MPKIAEALLVPVMIATLAFSSPGWSQESADHTTSIEEVQSETSEAFQAIGEYSIDQRDIAFSKIEQTMARIDDEIDALENRSRENWSEMTDEAKEQRATALRELRARRNELSERYGELKHGAETAWDELQEGFSDAWEALSDAWQSADDTEKAEESVE